MIFSKLNVFYLSHIMGIFYHEKEKNHTAVNLSAKICDVVLNEWGEGQKLFSAIEKFHLVWLCHVCLYKAGWTEELDSNLESALS